MRLIMLAAIAIPAATLAADSVSMDEGRYVETITLNSASLNGNPISPDLFDGSTESKAVCFTPEIAADPSLYFLHNSDNECTTPQGDIGDGRFDLSSRCSIDGKPPELIRVVGTYGGSGYDSIATMGVQLPQGRMEMEMTVTGRHVGACRGDEV